MWDLTFCKINFRDNKYKSYSVDFTSGRFSEKNELINKRFGLLTVLKKVRQTKGKKWVYLCACDCGNKCEKIGSNLKSFGNESTSCGCNRKKSAGFRSWDMSGIVYGGIEGVKKIGKSLKGEPIWLFRCTNCGKELTMVGRYVREKPTFNRCDCGKIAAKRKIECENKKERVKRNSECLAWDIYCGYIKEGVSLREAALLTGFERGASLTHLLIKNVPEYKEQSEKRRKNSSWAKQLEKTKYKSKIFRFEKELQEYCVKKIKGRGVYCDEKNKELTGFEIDILTSEYCYELKVTTVKKDIYRAIGQLSINAAKSKLKPALVVPSDTRIHKDMLPILDECGIAVLTELTI